MNITEEMMQVAQHIHESRMEYIGRSVTSSEINNIDVRVKFDAWMFLKLAELEVRIKQLEKVEITQRNIGKIACRNQIIVVSL